MTSISKVVVVLLLALAASCTSEGTLQGHQLRLFAVEQPDVNWITQEDVASAQRTNASIGQPTLRLHLKPEAESRMMALTSANIGKTVRFTWDGRVVSDMKVVSSFGRTFELPAPPESAGS
jgi:preprotein translocase subunit SecD